MSGQCQIVRKHLKLRNLKYVRRSLKQVSNSLHYVRKFSYTSARIVTHQEGSQTCLGGFPRVKRPWNKWRRMPKSSERVSNVQSQFSRSFVSESLWPHGLQPARLPCPLPIPRACSNSCPSSRWCQPTISFSVVPFSSCLKYFPGSQKCQVGPQTWSF